MHHMHNQPKTKDAPQTSGLTIHWAAQYDFMTSLLGLGVNRANSKMVIELAQIKPGDRVLDVGCGSGNLTLTAKTYAGPNGAVAGIDAAPEMISVARQKAAQKGLQVDFQVGLIEKIPFPDASFDVVISRLVLHHLPFELKRQGFAEIRRILKPGGFFLAADFEPPTNPVLAHLASAVVGQHMMQTSTRDLPALLKEAGFAEVAAGPTRSKFLAFVSGKNPAV